MLAIALVLTGLAVAFGGLEDRASAASKRVKARAEGGGARRTGMNPAQIRGCPMELPAMTAEAISRSPPGLPLRPARTALVLLCPARARRPRRRLFLRRGGDRSHRQRSGDLQPRDHCRYRYQRCRRHRH
ncbi:MAG: hypothetical protein R2716_08745 [Microthrixaceae bacterium]